MFSAPSEPVKLWFFNLKRIQDKMKDLNHLTEGDLKEFAKQKPSDLLTSGLLQNSLAQFCQSERIGLVFDNAFNESAFLGFLKFISFSIEEAILRLLYRVAVQFRPDLLNLKPSQLAQKTMKEIYGSGPLESNIVLRELDELLRMNIPATFYPLDGAPIDNDDRKIKDAIHQILT